MIKKLRFIKTSAYLAILLAASNSAFASQYKITDLGTLGGSGGFSVAYGINDFGDVVGYSYSSITNAFLYSNGTMQDLGINGVATDINNLRQIVGVQIDPNLSEKGFVYSNGVTTTISSNYISSGLYAINDQGIAVGRLGYGEAVLYSNGQITQIGTLGGSYSSAQDINEFGQIAGASDRSGNGTQHAFLYDGAQTIDLGTLGGEYSWATSLNNLGQVVGGAYVSGGLYHAYIYDGGPLFDIGTLGGSESSANAINDTGYVVGNSTTGNNEYHAFLYNAGILRDLNSFAGVAGSGWTLTDALDINEFGQIVGYGYNPEGQSRAFLLTPVPEPEAYGLMLTGLSLIGVALRRRQKQVS